tara:strand:- start:5101 stop:5265 length:165 start_codon:yes stop_codon:yes gene_type:complete
MLSATKAKTKKTCWDNKEKKPKVELFTFEQSRSNHWQNENGHRKQQAVSDTQEG